MTCFSLMGSIGEAEENPHARRSVARRVHDVRNERLTGAVRHDDAVSSSKHPAGCGSARPGDIGHRQRHGIRAGVLPDHSPNCGGAGYRPGIEILRAE